MASAIHYVPFLIFTVIIAVLLHNSNMVSGSPDTTVVFFQCSSDAYNPSDTLYKGNVAYVLQDIISRTASSGYDYYTSSSGPEKAFAHGACNGVLSAQECQACLSFTFPKIVNGCPYAVGSTLQFKDCRARYENYPFFE